MGKAKSTSADAFDSNTDFEMLRKICNWCGRHTLLATNKQFCQVCADKCVQECKRCHRPYSSLEYFTLDKERCNACHHKLMAEREVRAQKKAALLDVRRIEEDQHQKQKQQQQQQKKTGTADKPQTSIAAVGTPVPSTILNFVETDQRSATLPDTNEKKRKRQAPPLTRQECIQAVGPKAKKLASASTEREPQTVRLELKLDIRHRMPNFVDVEITSVKTTMANKKWCVRHLHSLKAAPLQCSNSKKN